MSEDEYIYSDADDMDQGTDEEDERTMKPEPKRPSLANNNANLTFLKKLVEYSALSPEDLQLEQNQLTSQVSELTGLPEDQASVLLLYFRWNKESFWNNF
ncbi:hypothetical protein BASA82_000409 [Batrachochytrium salamandrivorans]|nr:hypothetical protein BASA82_000409 [Batrachochytrium salamandrivorans]